MKGKKSKQIRKLIKQITGLDFNANGSVRKVYRGAKKKV